MSEGFPDVFDEPASLRRQVKRLEAENAALRLEVERLRATPGRHAPTADDRFDDDPLTWERLEMAAGA